MLYVCYIINCNCEYSNPNTYLFFTIIFFWHAHYDLCLFMCTRMFVMPMALEDDVARDASLKNNKSRTLRHPIVRR